MRGGRLGCEWRQHCRGVRHPSDTYLDTSSAARCLHRRSRVAHPGQVDAPRRATDDAGWGRCSGAMTCGIPRCAAKCRRAATSDAQETGPDDVVRTDAALPDADAHAIGRLDDARILRLSFGKRRVTLERAPTRLNRSSSGSGPRMIACGSPWLQRDQARPDSAPRDRLATDVWLADSIDAPERLASSPLARSARSRFVPPSVSSTTSSRASDGRRATDNAPSARTPLPDTPPGYRPH